MTANDDRDESQLDIADEFELTPEIYAVFMELKDVFSIYISNYVHVLNKYIGVLRKVSTLRFERSTLIKYVKKLRFYNDRLSRYSFSNPEEIDEIIYMKPAVREISSFYLKVLETVDILNYYLTRSVQSEIVSKTLNFSLTVPERTITKIEESYNYFIKCIQWTMESISIDDELLQIEIIQFSLKCALEDNVDLEQTDNIFLQEVAPVESIEEYDTLASQWVAILSTSVSDLNSEFELCITNWLEASEKKRT